MCAPHHQWGWWRRYRTWCRVTAWPSPHNTPHTLNVTLFLRSWGMVRLGLGHWLTRGMRAPPPLKPTPMGYGGAWVRGLGWGHEFGLAIESPPCHLTSPTSPTSNPRQWTHAQNPRPNPSPRGSGSGVFTQPNPHTP
ncbi:hypothetical protein Hanom_Chr12g01113831 [Helianthus anomalus]